MNERQTISSPANQSAASVPAQENNTLHDVDVQQPCSFLIQPKLTVGAPDDPLEHEADAMADTVMRMPAYVSDSSKAPGTYAKGTSTIQRKCAHCEEEEKETVQRKPLSASITPFIQTKSNGEGTASNALTNNINNSRGGGSNMDGGTRSFMETRFGSDFSNIKIHTGNESVQMNRELNAKAFTVGNDIYFNKGQYDPASNSGKHLLAHELTHTVQQGAAPGIIQRTIHRGTDYAGNYAIDTSACTLNYSQDWYFHFPSSMNAAQQTSYMSSAESQVESVWSGKHKIRPDGAGTCPCSANGFDVNVDLITHNEDRDGRHGYDTTVTTEATTGLTQQHRRDVTLSDSHDTPVNMGSGLTQQRIAHEFGHTLGITDEYHWWARLPGALGHNDRPSIMHSGDNVRPRHYQHFADIINEEIESCTFEPEGIGTRSLRNPLARFGVTGGFDPGNAQFILSLQLDRRIGNSELLGVMSPSVGFNTTINTATGNVMLGPTFGLSLNRLAHPLYIDVRTGVLFDPEDSGRPASLNLMIPSPSIGFRGSGFNVGAAYTGMYDVLGNSGYSHLVGVNLSVDLP